LFETALLRLIAQITMPHVLGSEKTDGSGRKRESFNKTSSIGIRTVGDDGRIRYIYQKRNRPEGYDPHAARKRKRPKQLAGSPLQENGEQNSIFSIKIPQSSPHLKVCKHSYFDPQNINL